MPITAMQHKSATQQAMLLDAKAGYKNILKITATSDEGGGVFDFSKF